MNILSYVPVVHLIITVLGVGGVLFWLGRNIKALKGTVAAQEKTIDAQAQNFMEINSLLYATRAVFESLDERSMLERLKAYKAFVDHEMEAAIAQERQNFTSIMKGSQQQIVSLQEFIERFLTDAYYMSALLAFVPKELRQIAIRNLPFSAQGENIREMLYKIDRALPDFSVKSFEAHSEDDPS